MRSETRPSSESCERTAAVEIPTGLVDDFLDEADGLVFLCFQGRQQSALHLQPTEIGTLAGLLALTLGDDRATLANTHPEACRGIRADRGETLRSILPDTF